LTEVKREAIFVIESWETLTDRNNQNEVIKMATAQETIKALQAMKTVAEFIYANTGMDCGALENATFDDIHYQILQIAKGVEVTREECNAVADAGEEVMSVLVTRQSEEDFED
jgi:hypothetical protein